MNDELLSFVKECIRKDDMHAFYVKSIWKKKRLEIMQRDHYECQSCKRKGKITVVNPNSKYRSQRAYVHHIKHLRKYPELAVDDDNLETLCFECHELEHIDERNPFQETKPKFKNDEKW